jgi:hypothetical protein
MQQVGPSQFAFGTPHFPGVEENIGSSKGHHLTFALRVQISLWDTYSGKRCVWEARTVIVYSRV